MIKFKSVKFVILIMLLCSTLTVGGCWDSTELQYFGVVLGAGIDIIPESERVGNNKILLTVAIASLGKSDSGLGDDPQSNVYEASGESVAIAARNLTNVIDQQLFWGHDQVLLIGEEILNDGLNKHLDFFIRNSKIRPAMRLIAVKGNAKDYFGNTGSNSVIFSYGTPAVSINNLQQGLATASYVTLQNYMETAITGYSATILPLAHKQSADIKNTQATGGSSSPETDSTAPASQNPSDSGEDWKKDSATNRVSFDGMVVLSTAGQTVISITAEETISAMLWNSQIHSFLISCPYPDSASETDIQLSFTMDDIKIRRSWRYNGNSPLLKLDVSFSAILEEINSGGDIYSANIYSKEDMNAINELLQKEMHRHLLLAWDKAMETKQDFIGLGTHMRRYNNKEWQIFKDNWSDSMNAVKLEIKTSSSVKFIGDINNAKNQPDFK